jgi:hypothetical protein
VNRSSLHSADQLSEEGKRRPLANRSLEKENTMRLLSTVLMGGVLALTTFAPLAPAVARTPAPAAAGSAAPTAPKPEEEVKKFEAAVNKLGLSAEQKPKFASLMQEVRASLKKIESTSDAPAVKQQQMTKLRTSAKDKLDHILTVAQDRELKKMMAPAKSGAAAH